MGLLQSTASKQEQVVLGNEMRGLLFVLDEKVKDAVIEEMSDAFIEGSTPPTLTALASEGGAAQDATSAQTLRGIEISIYAIVMYISINAHAYHK